MLLQQTFYDILRNILLSSAADTAAQTSPWSEEELDAKLAGCVATLSLAKILLAKLITHDELRKQDLSLSRLVVSM